MDRPPPPIPPAARAGMEAWEATLAWSFAPGRATWRLRAPDGAVRYLKVAARAGTPTLTRERDRLRWAEHRLPVPRVLAHGDDGTDEWLLTAGLPGTPASDHHGADPRRLVPALAQGLRRLHAVPPGGCPFDGRIAVAVREVEARVAAGLIDPERDLHTEHRRAGVTAQDALAELRRQRPPDEDLVLCHGDYCLPNVLLEGETVTGYVDLGALCVADRWRDLAVATWSVTWNLGPGWEDAFLAAYGVARDPARLAFYRLLYDMLP